MYARERPDLERTSGGLARPPRVKVTQRTICASFASTNEPLSPALEGTLPCVAGFHELLVRCAETRRGYGLLFRRAINRRMVQQRLVVMRMWFAEQAQ